MGRSKIKIEKIENDKARNIAFNKRKKGLLKKSMELSILCDVQIYLFIFQSNFLTQYKSHPIETICAVKKVETVTNHDIVHNYSIENTIKSTYKTLLKKAMGPAHLQIKPNDIPNSDLHSIITKITHNSKIESPISSIFPSYPLTPEIILPINSANSMTAWLNNEV